MEHFSVAFTIISERSCPFYKVGDWFVLTSQSVLMPSARPACLILVREFTNLLLVLAPEAEDGFVAQRRETYNCGGCTGLIKFQIDDQPEGLEQGRHPPAVETGQGTVPEKERKSGAIVSGTLDQISPSELLQFFHMHQKTGKLLLQVPGGAGRVAFREGAIIGARFENKENKEAIFSLLGEQKGRFSFVPGIPPSLTTVEEIGDFMMMLMEGIKRLDEKKDEKGPGN